MCSLLIYLSPLRVSKSTRNACTPATKSTWSTTHFHGHFTFDESEREHGNISMQHFCASPLIISISVILLHHHRHHRCYNKSFCICSCRPAASVGAFGSAHCGATQIRSGSFAGLWRISIVKIAKRSVRKLQPVNPGDTDSSVSIFSSEIIYISCSNYYLGQCMGNWIRLI